MRHDPLDVLLAKRTWPRRLVRRRIDDPPRPRAHQRRFGYRGNHGLHPSRKDRPPGFPHLSRLHDLRCARDGSAPGGPARLGPRRDREPSVPSSGTRFSGSTSSIRPMSTRAAPARRCWGGFSRPTFVASPSSSRRRSTASCATSPTGGACPARPSSTRSRRACVDWEPTTSTCIRFTAGIRKHPSRRPWRPCTTS